MQGIYAAGGWAQLTFKARADLDLNLAYGREDPRNRDLLAGVKGQAARFRNDSLMTNFIYRLRQNFLLSLEYRRLWSDYAAGRQRNGHYNIGIGYLF